jgi:hypothetical protein
VHRRAETAARDNGVELGRPASARARARIAAAQTTGRDEEESPSPELPTRLLSLETALLAVGVVQALIAKSA